MNILIYRYGSICEPAIINAFHKNGLEVIEITNEMSNKQILASQRVQILHEYIDKYHPLFVFSINFFPSIADICKIHNTFYLCWTVDSPVLELFSNSIKHETNNIFLFDKAQYMRFAKYNMQAIHHLPLAADITQYNSVIKTIDNLDRQKYACDISFVGSLYSEKNRLKMLNLSPYNKGYIDGIVSASLNVYGYNFIEELITNELTDDFIQAGVSFPIKDCIAENLEAYTIAHSYIGYQAAESERIYTLNELAKHFSVELYTRSDTSPLNNVIVHSGIHTLTEMPKVFHLSKINLNMTIKPIQTGLPLRIFDIMGCGGFVMTNYQAELEDLFEIGTDLEAYASLDELIEKCDFYLKHDDIRTQIALNGYNKVFNHHTYQHRIAEMLRVIVG